MSSICNSSWFVPLHFFSNAFTLGWSRIVGIPLLYGFTNFVAAKPLTLWNAFKLNRPCSLVIFQYRNIGILTIFVMMTSCSNCAVSRFRHTKNYYQSFHNNQAQELRMTSRTYKLKYIHDALNHPKSFTSNTSVTTCDVIEVDTGDFRYVEKIEERENGYQLFLSGPLESGELAYLSSIRQGCLIK